MTDASISPLGMDASSLSSPALPDSAFHVRRLLPVRMLNEYAYCPRLFHLMHVEGRWADNAFTVEGSAVHRRVDQIDHLLPDAVDASAATAAACSVATDGAAASPGPTDSSPKPSAKKGKGKSAARLDNDEPPVVSRSVPLDSPTLGLTAKLDLVSTAQGSDGVPDALPVETKRGRVPENPERSYEPERVQLMAQGLLLREHGYRCDRGVLYFAGSRTRVDVPFTSELESRTLELISLAHAAAESTHIPDPLHDSPKCRHCSLAGICLPDETLALKQLAIDPALIPPGNRIGEITTGPNATSLTQDADSQHHSIRRLYPPREDALPFYVQEQGASVGKRSESLVVSKQGVELAKTALINVSQLVLCGSVSVSAQTLHLLCEANIPVVHLSMGHWFYGITHGQSLRNAYDRAAQFAAAGQPERCLTFAREIVVAKGINQRTLIRRNASPSDRTLADMSSLIDRAQRADSLATLLGIEGNLASLYFSNFAGMLKPRDFDSQWDFKNRNRRPPKDPVNALLSFGYSLLAKECTVALLTEGLDPWWGFYHQPRHGRPALALDVMEPFRPAVVDSAVITAINTGMITAKDFIVTKSGCAMEPTGRKAMIRAYEGRLDQLVTHPLFDYKCSWRSIIRLQARLLSRWLRGDVPSYTSLTIR